ncbi:hypothetical protein C8F01DRAFT_718918 [Mycena amicta]|nr:hypothetical protein C8F01DRAFT_718918 [Mycena amicta]
MGRRRRTIDSTVATLLHLPPEICWLICDLVERKTLLQLSRVSRSFCDQAQRIIHHTVDLRSDPKALSSWCRAVSRNPKLGGYLRRLTLSSAQMSPDSDNAAKVARALQKCSNLKRLAVHTSLTIPSYLFAENATHTWVIDKGPFRLTHFSNTFFRNSFLHGFWNKQTEIQLLSLPLLVCGAGGKDKFPCHDDQLPNLVALDVTSTTQLPTTPRPLERIQIQTNQHQYHVERDLSLLSRFSTTLTTLNLCEIAVPSISSTIAIVAQAVPNLLHLGITEKLLLDYLKDNDVSGAVQESPRVALGRLRRLKTFVIYTYYIEILVDATNNRSYPLSDPKSVAELFMQISPHLEQVIVGGYVERVLVGRRRRSEETCKLTRSETTGEVSVELGAGYDFAGVGRFWNV